MDLNLSLTLLMATSTLSRLLFIASNSYSHFMLNFQFLQEAARVDGVRYSFRYLAVLARMLTLEVAIPAVLL